MIRYDLPVSVQAISEKHLKHSTPLGPALQRFRAREKSLSTIQNNCHNASLEISPD
jgi:hypothetical protein